jgi:protein-disulfide isomerase
LRFTVINRLVFFTLAAILLSATHQASAQTPDPAKSVPTTAPVSQQQRETIENIVREYLLRNPSIIREAMQALQVQEEKEKQQRAANNLKELKSDLYSDPDSPMAGNPKGDVTIVVFFDYNCGYCKSTLPALQTLLSKDRSLRIVYKEFPILGPESQVAAQAALAAHRQGKYGAFHQRLLESARASNHTIKSISARLGLNYATLLKDMADPKLQESLDRNIRVASALDISGTPAFIIGEQIIPGAIDLDSLAKAVSAERAKLLNGKTGESTENKE